MKVGIVSTFDNHGGAAKAAFRLHKGLVNSGNNSKMYVQRKDIDDINIIEPNTKLHKLRSLIYPQLDRLPLQLYPNRDQRIFSTGFFSSSDISKIDKYSDVINVHWVSGGFQSVKSIYLTDKPLVLSLHDSWAFTGGCHVPFECEKFIEKCGSCIQLQSNNKFDLSRLIWKNKFNLLSKKNLVLVADGNWVAENARRSSIFRNHRVEVVHPGLDLNLFKPINKSVSRSILGVDASDKVILFGAMSATSDINKGFHLLMPALKRFSRIYPPNNVKLLVFGDSAPKNTFPDLDFRVQYFGKLNDEISLSILYSAADVMVVPSLQEAFGQTASESFACGTPVVAFRSSGLKDIVDHKLNGFLSNPYDPNDLAEGISWVLSDPTRLKQLSIEARNKAVASFGIERCVENYLKIYESILK